MCNKLVLVQTDCPVCQRKNVVKEERFLRNELCDRARMSGKLCDSMKLIYQPKPRAEWRECAPCFEKASLKKVGMVLPDDEHPSEVFRKQREEREHKERAHKGPGYGGKFREELVSYNQAGESSGGVQKQCQERQASASSEGRHSRSTVSSSKVSSTSSGRDRSSSRYKAEERRR